jgi:hypothetical protein
VTKLSAPSFKQAVGKLLGAVQQMEGRRAHGAP